VCALDVVNLDKNQKAPAIYQLLIIRSALPCTIVCVSVSESVSVHVSVLYLMRCTFSLLILSSYPEPLRLFNGRSRCSGRLEIFHSNSWGTVCDDEWELDSADVVCRQLGCGHALSSPGNSEFGAGSGPIWLDNVVCNGEEEALSQCVHQEFGENNCGHHEDVGVICLGE